MDPATSTLYTYFHALALHDALPISSPVKQFLGPRAIGPYVFGQRLKPVKLRFGPQIMVQFDCDLLAVKVAGKIEQMHLQQLLRRIEHRAYADVRGPVEYPPVGKAAAPRINPIKHGRGE